MSRKARAWLALTAALALHAIDEASNDFLSTFYNPMVLRMRERFDWFPMPTFEYRSWLVGLTLTVLILLLLTPAVSRGGRGAALAGYVFAAIMLLNGIAHIAFSLLEGRMVAGVWTAPVLIAASLYAVRAFSQQSASADKR